MRILTLLIALFVSFNLLASPSTVTKEQFLRTMDEIRALYGPIVAQQDFGVIIVPKWESDAVNAYTVDSSERVIFIMGGFARAPHMTVDGVALTLCHELGHNLAGDPMRPMYVGEPWSSVEGQSDYYATSKCLKRYFDEYYREVDPVKMNLSPRAVSKCLEVYGEGRDNQICLRSMIAGRQVARTLAQEFMGHTNISYDTPSLEIASETNESYPPMQCRLDTYFNGALCDVDYRSSEYCLEGPGARPRCWYAPKN